jgi:protein-S-isoprenylcysteine O-methyltransferase Ste14
MMWSRGIAGAVLLLVGAVWIAQGTDVLHGSGMSGQGQWTVIGGVCAVVGLALLAWTWRIRTGQPRKPA